MKKTEAERLLRAHGYVLERVGGIHNIWRRGNETVALPRAQKELHGFLRQLVLKGTRGIAQAPRVNKGVDK